MNKPLLIVQTGQPPAAIYNEIGQQSDWILAALSLTQSECIILRPDLDESLPPPEACCGAIITGSWAMVTDAARHTDYTAEWIREVHSHNLPLFGICYGHQLIAHALGGTVDYNPKGPEYGKKLISLGENGNDPLLNSLPHNFFAWLSHQQSVIKAPEGALILASSEQDNCQIIRYSNTSYSVQFHPEFTGNIMNECMLNNHVPTCPDITSTENVWPKLLLNRFYTLFCSADNLLGLQ